MGSVLFRLLVAMALRWGLNPNDLKLITAAFVFVALVLPRAHRRVQGPAAEARRCLRSSNIRKTFHPGTPNEVRALQGVAMPLETGSFTIIIGTNGSGKSTLLNAVAGSFFVDRGQLRIDGTDVTRWPEHRRARLIGRVFQNPFSGTAPNLSIAENLALAARRGLPRGLGLALGSQLRGEMRDVVRQLNMSLEDRLDNAIGTSLRRPAPGADAADGDLAEAEAPAARRTYRRARSEERRPGDRPDRRDRRARPADHAHGDAFDAAGGRIWATG